MDPNEALRRLREVMPRLRAWDEREGWTQSAALLTQHDADCREAADCFEALDEWLTKGGHAPAAWPLVGMAR